MAQSTRIAPVNKTDIIRVMATDPDHQYRSVINYTYHQFGWRSARALVALHNGGHEVSVQSFGKGFLIDGRYFRDDETRDMADRLLKAGKS